MRLGDKTARILVVDDNPDNRDLLSLRLTRQGHKVTVAEDGEQALRHLRSAEFDLVLLDVIMPRLDGMGVLRAMKHVQGLSNIPVIMISAVEEVDTIVKCIELGAEDYLGKPFDPALLRARINACLEKKMLRDQEVQSQKVIAQQLSEAATYVRSLLPKEMDGEVKAVWRFIPSDQLGGDSFGYHWLDPDHLAIYLLDVTGHGVGAALLSVSVMNVLRSGALPDTDFLNPASVLGSLNKAFPREKQNNKLFSLWYGIYRPSSRRLIYAGGGHPPAFLIHRRPDSSLELTRLQTLGLLIGCIPDYPYRNSEIDLQPDTRLYIYSDGAYEIEQPDGEVMELDAFAELLLEARQAEHSMDHIINRIYKINRSTVFKDDLSLVEISV